MEGKRDALKEKNGNKFAVTMYGDSTLRHISQKALACDVDERLINLEKKQMERVLSPPKQSFLDLEGQVRERLY